MRGGGDEGFGGDQRAGACEGELSWGEESPCLFWLFLLTGERGGGQTMRFAQPGLSEGDLRAHFEYICARGGAQRPAYVPVVASG